MAQLNKVLILLALWFSPIFSMNFFTTTTSAEDQHITTTTTTSAEDQHTTTTTTTSTDNQLPDLRVRLNDTDQTYCWFQDTLHLSNIAQNFVSDLYSCSDNSTLQQLELILPFTLKQWNSYDKLLTLIHRKNIRQNRHDLSDLDETSLIQGKIQEYSKNKLVSLLYVSDFLDSDPISKIALKEFLRRSIVNADHFQINNVILTDATFEQIPGPVQLNIYKKLIQCEGIQKYLLSQIVNSILVNRNTPYALVRINNPIAITNTKIFGMSKQNGIMNSKKIRMFDRRTGESIAFPSTNSDVEYLAATDNYLIVATKSTNCKYQTQVLNINQENKVWCMLKRYSKILSLHAYDNKVIIVSAENNNLTIERWSLDSKTTDLRRTFLLTDLSPQSPSSIRLFNNSEMTWGEVEVNYAYPKHMITRHQREQAIRIWNIDTGICEHTINAEPESFFIYYYVSFNKIVTVSYKNTNSSYTMHVWNIKNGICEHSMPFPNNLITNWNNSIRIEDTDGKPIYIQNIIGSPHIVQNKFLVWNYNSSAKVYNLENGRFLFQTTIDDLYRRRFSIQLLGNKIVTAGHGTERAVIQIWNLESQDCEYELPIQASALEVLDATENNIVIRIDNNNLHIYNIQPYSECTNFLNNIRDIKTVKLLSKLCQAHKNNTHIILSNEENALIPLLPPSIRNLFRLHNLHNPSQTEPDHSRPESDENPHPSKRRRLS